MVVNMLEVVWSDLVSFTQLGAALFLNVLKLYQMEGLIKSNSAVRTKSCVVCLPNFSCGGGIRGENRW